MANLILKSTRFGKSVFAGNKFKPGEKIMKFGGKIFAYNQLPKPYDSVEDHYLQIGKKSYIGPSGSFDDFINHSCNPNTGLKIKGKGTIICVI